MNENSQTLKNNQIMDFIQIEYYPKIYINNENEEFITFGSNGDVPINLYLHSFNDKIDSDWNEFLDLKIIPQLVLKQVGKDISAKGNLKIFKELLDKKTKISKKSDDFIITKKEITPSYDEYLTLIKNITEEINDNKGLKKVVVPRKTSLYYEGELDLVSIIKEIKNKTNNSTIYMVAISSNQILLGATPELLFRTDKHKIYTEALAGTFFNEIKDGNEIDFSKNEQENIYVQNFLEDKLKKIAFDIEKSKLKIVKASNVSHFKCLFKATLNKNYKFEEIANMLHPTPAMACYPSNLKKYIDNEFFSRGLYSGFLGIEKEDTKHCYVLIRCIQIKHNKVNMYVGSGVVKDSTPEKEWDELNKKQYVYDNYFV